MRLITPDRFASMPWRNGGGVTHEIAVEPPGASMAQGFLWRLSIAEVASDGPFSSFPGLERTIMLLDGNGMTLTPDRGAPMVLDDPLAPLTFDGALAIEGRLHDGPVRDFNLMVDASRARGSISILDAPAHLPSPGDDHLLRAVFNPSADASLSVGSRAVPPGALLLATRDDPSPAAEIIATSRFRFALIEVVKRSGEG